MVTETTFLFLINLYSVILIQSPAENGMVRQNKREDMTIQLKPEQRTGELGLPLPTMGLGISGRIKHHIHI